MKKSNQKSPKLFLTLFFLSILSLSFAQGYWQQEVDYTMEIDMNAPVHQFKGKQTIIYTNNSPETLDKVFYHLYFNAFQPGSMMDVRSRTIIDPSSKIRDRIYYLEEDEIGYHIINTLKQDGKKVKYFTEGTILEVQLNKPIAPGQNTVLEMEFDAQVPLQIRRSGRDSDEGIEFTMTQWYPKLCEYDRQGWHANPYIAREFHGVWGDFKVSIDMDKDYIIGGSGLLQKKTELNNGKYRWEFFAENVHDFAWAADPDYKYVQYEAYNGTVFNYYYQSNDRTEENWSKLPKIMDEALKFLNEMCGEYPYPQYSIIQGGDGGMEYPMCTMITGERNLSSLVSVSVHELLHSWYQMILGTNEALYYWMDEGFTVYYQDKCLNHLRKLGLIPGEYKVNPHLETLQKYIDFHKTGREEPLTIHADHFVTNSAYSRAAYSKGAVYLDQLEYVVGDEVFAKSMLEYFEKWKFKHPTPLDLLRIMEKNSGLELDWYNEYFVQTTRPIDYGILAVEEGDGKTVNLTLEKIGLMPMPIDLVVTKTNGKKETYYIPLRIMRGEKKFKDKKINLAMDWPWTHPYYFLELEGPMEEIQSIEIDPSRRMADINRYNNLWLNQGQ